MATLLAGLDGNIGDMELSVTICVPRADRAANLFCDDPF